ncbi:hypothetical protein JCM5296_005784 [Sporobolomyces johnsonii]
MSESSQKRPTPVVDTRDFASSTQASPSPQPVTAPPRLESATHSAQAPSPNDCCHPPDLSGWGRGGDRFGGMAQAAPRQPGMTSDSASTGSSSASAGTSESEGEVDSAADADEAEGVRRAKSVEDMLAAERMEAEKRDMQVFEAGGSNSYHGGMNQGFMRMIHALAQEDPERSARSEDAFAGFDRPVRRSPRRTISLPNATQSRSRTPSPSAPHMQPSKTLPHLSQGSESEHKPQRGQVSDDEGDRTDTSDAAPRKDQFISPLSPADCTTSIPSPTSSRAGETKLPRLGKPTQSLVAAEDDDLSKSSIIAIHRPIAARRRTETGEPGECQGSNGMYASQTSEGEIKEEGSEIGEGDAEGAGVEKQEEKRPVPMGRTETVRTEKSIARRLKLAEKLMDVFGLEEVEDVVAEFPCWLFRSVLLQGYLYLTTGHICFYAYLSQKEGTTVRSGSLSVRSGKTRRYHKHWFVLKDSVLSWYPSSTDPYFPDGHIDFHYCISVEPSTRHKHHFKVSTNEKRWHFSADSEASRDEWVKTIKKVVFRCQNEGESVKIAIPLETVVDIERSSSLEFAETIRLRVYDADEGFSIDEYWLSYFKDIDVALDKLNLVLQAFRRLHPEGERRVLSDNEIEDTTRKAAADLNDPNDQRKAVPEKRDPERSDSKHRSLTERVSSVLSDSKGKSDSPATAKSTGSPAKASSGTSLSSKLKLFSGSSASTPASGSVATLRPLNEGAAHPTEPPVDALSTVSASAAPVAVSEHSSSETIPAVAAEHTYPPEPSGPAPALQRPRRASTLSKIISASSSSVSHGSRRILEVVTHSTVPGRKGQQKDKSASEKRPEPGKSMFDEPLVEEPEDEDLKDDESDKVDGEFRKTFGLSDKEELIEQFPAYLFRGLPIYGRIYISTNFFCFRSSGILSARTKMILPTSDIIGVSKHRSYRIGFSGLMIVIKGHEEVFMELSNSERRDACLEKLEERVEIARQHRAENKDADDSAEHRELQALLDLSASQATDPVLDNPQPRSEAVTGQPPVMFSSTTSDFVTFRPEKSLRFTCLTIGSRGDVQPYIALCKGLIAQGHKCKIASHAEYRKWVEGHGIEFSAVGGDPAELMQLMISHDFFTISFMKEAIGRFRGWLDDLLDSAWKGCQDTDVLIESPSAIAGYHVAEALQIPYYRAFTMPWSRTRAYPHAFAVPEIKMGGGYNYMTYTMFDQVFWRATSGQVNRWRKDTLHIRPTSLDAMQQHKIPFLYNFSPVIIPPPLDWRENIHVTGYWWLDNPDDSKSKKWEPPKDLLEFLDKAKSDEKKVVFIGFGSIIIPDPVEMTRVIAEAVEKAGVCAIVAKGWSDRAGSKDDTEDQKKHAEEQERTQSDLLNKPFIYNVKAIPHDWLFPRIAAAVHHGGAGTTGASLRAGLPTIIRPFFGDQHFYADRVATLGIGTHLRNFTVDALTEALTTAVSDEKQIERARQAGEDIRKEDGVATAIECIYRDLEYARSLIPAPTDVAKELDLAGPDEEDEDAEDIASSVAKDLDAAKETDEKEKGRGNGEGVGDEDHQASRSRHSISTSGSSPRAGGGGGGGGGAGENESRTTSSDEGWDVMSRASATESAASVSRGSSKARSPSASRGEGEKEKERGGGGVGEEEAGGGQSGLTARMLSMLGKPIHLGGGGAGGGGGGQNAKEKTTASK